jgi:uncharacterized membrane protein YeiH
MMLWFDYLGVVVFAITGCLVAAKHRVDIVGFIWLATVTAVGGGTVRDLILARPVFWLDDPTYLWLCLATGVIMFFAAHWVHRRVRYLLWGDALGLAVFAVIGTQIALAEGATPLVTVVCGVITATLGGVLRDILAGEPTLIMRREIYVTAAVLSSVSYLLMQSLGVYDSLAAVGAIALGFGLRSLAIRYRLVLPGYRVRLLQLEDRRMHKG